MKTVIFILLPFMIVFQLKLNAQEVISFSGDYFINNVYGSLSYTFGELVIETCSGTEYKLTQGFQQSRLVIEPVDQSLKTEIVVFANPNPSRDLIKINVENSDAEKLTFKLLNTGGKKLLQGQFEPPETEIPLENLSPSVYILKIYSGREEVKAIRIIKQ